MKRLNDNMTYMAKKENIKYFDEEILMMKLLVAESLQKEPKKEKTYEEEFELLLKIHDAIEY